MTANIEIQHIPKLSESESEREREGERERERGRKRERERERERETDKERDRDRETEREIQWNINISFQSSFCAIVELSEAKEIQKCTKCVKICHYDQGAISTKNNHFTTDCSIVTYWANNFLTFSRHRWHCLWTPRSDVTNAVGVNPIAEYEQVLWQPKTTTNTRKDCELSR